MIYLIKLHHIGIACEDIVQMAKYLEDTLGVKEKSEIVYDSLQDANLCMVTTIDSNYLELISGNMLRNI